MELLQRNRKALSHYTIVNRKGRPLPRKESESVLKIIAETLAEEGRTFLRYPIGYVVYRGLGLIPVIPIPDRTAERIADKIAPGGFRLLSLNPQIATLMKRLAVEKNAAARTQLQNQITARVDTALLSRLPRPSPPSKPVTPPRMRVPLAAYAEKQRQVARVLAAARRPGTTKTLAALSLQQAAVETARKRLLEKR